MLSHENGLVSILLHSKGNNNQCLFLVVVEKENNKAIIVDIASPWDHRVYEKEYEKIKKYQDLKRETGRLWGIRHLEAVPLSLAHLELEKLGVTIRTGLLQKTALLGTARILRELLES